MVRVVRKIDPEDVLIECTNHLVQNATKYREPVSPFYRVRPYYPDDGTVHFENFAHMSVVKVDTAPNTFTATITFLNSDATYDNCIKPLERAEQHVKAHFVSDGFPDFQFEILIEED